MTDHYAHLVRRCILDLPELYKTAQSLRLADLGLLFRLITCHLHGQLASLAMRAADETA